MKEKFIATTLVLPRSRKQCNFTSSVATVIPWIIWGNEYSIPIQPYLNPTFAIQLHNYVIFQANDSISETINVQDRPGLKHEKKWCTEVPNKGQLTFKEECLKICTDFGQQICLSPPEKIAPTSDCLEHAQTCSCCCQPSCDESLRPNCEQTSTLKRDYLILIRT